MGKEADLTVIVHEGVRGIGETTFWVQAGSAVSVFSWKLHVDDWSDVQPANKRWNTHRGYSRTWDAWTPQQRRTQLTSETVQRCSTSRLGDSTAAPWQRCHPWPWAEEGCERRVWCRAVVFTETVSHQEEKRPLITCWFAFQHSGPS